MSDEDTTKARTEAELLRIAEAAVDRTFRDADAIVNKGFVLLSLLALLAAAGWALCRLDLGDAAGGPWETLYGAVSLVVVAAFAAAIGGIIAALRPRGYHAVGYADRWDKWCQEYVAYAEKAAEAPPLNEALREAVRHRRTEAARCNQAINERRHAWLGASVVAVSVALGALVFQGLLLVYLRAFVPEA